MLEELKDYLNITYDDPVTDRVLQGALERGKTVLNDYAGAELDYKEAGLPRQLLFDYCRYVRSHAAEMFEVNFRHDLISLRERTEVRKLADQNKHTVSDL
ncbi:MAG: hypothetical protein NC432_08775 [Roseburia sp.]|nr:hypothetical protein [Roseburia sp.]MCM1097793.1 hypothetical protein [Ruminococcus flavefaciens]